MRTRAGVICALSAVLLLAGCAAPAAEPAAEPSTRAAEPSSTPSPVAEPAASPTATPAEPEAAVDPIRLFGGDCGAMLTDGQLDGLLDAGWTPYDRFLESVDVRAVPRAAPEGTLGGLRCRWKAPDGSSSGLHDVTVLALPHSHVPAAFVDAFADKQCAPSYDASICRLARTVDDVWIMASAGYAAGYPGGEPSREALDRAVTAVAESLPARAGTPQRVTRTAQWWEEPSCEDLASRMRFDELTDGGFEHGYWEGSEQAEQTLLDAAGVSQHCPYYSAAERMSLDEEHRIFSVDTYPGGAWMWETLAGGATSIEIDGAVSAVSTMDGAPFGSLYATDGVNLVEVGGEDDIGFSVDVAERALAALASS